MENKQTNKHKRWKGVGQKVVVLYTIFNILIHTYWNRLTYYMIFLSSSSQPSMLQDLPSPSHKGKKDVTGVLQTNWSFVWKRGARNQDNEGIFVKK